jgi:cysteine sulfinate desulfinase/cysteine desulfurase-like protein
MAIKRPIKISKKSESVIQTKSAGAAKDIKNSKKYTPKKQSPRQNKTKKTQIKARSVKKNMTKDMVCPLKSAPIDKKLFEVDNFEIKTSIGQKPEFEKCEQGDTKETLIKSEKPIKFSAGKVLKKKFIMLNGSDGAYVSADAKKEYDKWLNATPDPANIRKCKHYIANHFNISTDTHSIFFMSREEANTTLIHSVVGAYRKIRNIKPHIITSAIEDSSILQCVISLQNSRQIDATILQPNVYGCVLSNKITAAVQPNTCLITVSHVNVDMGSIANINKMSVMGKNSQVPFHSDCTHIVGKYKVDMSTDIQAATISFGHVGGMAKQGALIINNKFLDGYKLFDHSNKLINENISIAGVVSSVVALQKQYSKRDAKNESLKKIRMYLETELCKKYKLVGITEYLDRSDTDKSTVNTTDLVLFGPPDERFRVSHLMSFAVIPKNEGLRYKSEQIYSKLWNKGIIISRPQKRVHKDHYIFRASNIPEFVFESAICVSLSDFNTRTDCAKFLDEIFKLFV